MDNTIEFKAPHAIFNGMHNLVTIGKRPNTMKVADWLKTPEGKESLKIRRQIERLNIKNLSLEDKQRLKEQKINNRYEKSLKKIEKERVAFVNKMVNRELSVLEYMLKTDVYNHYHGEKDSTIKLITEAIAYVKEHKVVLIRDAYVWNRLGEGNNHLPVCHFGDLWRSDEFSTIYDVPLDGSYLFYRYDSGERGLGSFHRISAKKVEEEIVVPVVNPGGLIQKIAY